jgi:hypothetical protein
MIMLAGCDVMGVKDDVRRTLVLTVVADEHGCRIEADSTVVGKDTQFEFAPGDSD